MKTHIYVTIFFSFVFFGCASYKNYKFLYLTTHLNYQLEKKNEAKQKRLENLLKSTAMQKVYAQNLVIKAEIRKLTQCTHFLLNTIQAQKQYLVQKVAGGINPQTGRLNEPMNVAGVQDYMLLGEGNPPQEGYKLKKRLDMYVDYLNKEFKSYGIATLPKFAEGNLDNVLYKNQPREKEKDFPEAYFRDTPVIMALTYLSHFETTVLSYQEKAIQHFLLNTITLTNGKE